MDRWKIASVVLVIAGLLTSWTPPAAGVAIHGTAVMSGQFQWQQERYYPWPTPSPRYVNMWLSSSSCTDSETGAKSTTGVGSWCYLSINLSNFNSSALQGSAYFHSSSGISSTGTVYLNDDTFGLYGYNVYGSSVITGTMTSSYLGGPVTISITFLPNCYLDCRPGASGTFFAEMDYALH